METSAGIGNFIKYAPKDVKVVCNEINKYSAKILQILYPHAVVYNKYFEQNFITKDNKSMKNKIDDLDKYSLIIGNPPYGKFTGKYVGMGEDTFTKASNFCEYFITRSLDLLMQDGLLIYIVGAEQFTGGTLFLDSKLSKVKEIIFDKAQLIDAYRLPVKIFERTGVSTEILIFRKK
jgi:type I restriction-modification system DNA methylase subunit